HDRGDVVLATFLAAATPGYLAGEAAAVSRLLRVRAQRPAPGQSSPRRPRRGSGHVTRRHHPSPAARLIGTPRRRTISAREVSHGRPDEPGWSGAGRGGASARVWRSGARAWRPDVTPAQDRGSAAAVAR